MWLGRSAGGDGVEEEERRWSAREILIEDGTHNRWPDWGELCTCTDHERLKMITMALAAGTIAFVIGIMNSINSMKENQRM